MIGITPDAFNFKGINCLFPPIKSCSKSPVTERRAYCTGIFLTAITIKIQATITSNQTIISKTISIGPPLSLVTTEENSWINACGILATIPTKINSEIPLPIPLSVIFSPNHIAKTVPVVSIITDENMNDGELNPNKKASAGNVL